MRTIVLLSTVVFGVASLASAQGADIGVSGTGLVSFQPADDYYVGGPYLSGGGIGGFAPGFGIGISGIFANGFVAAGEYTTARFAHEQSGRLVPGGSGTTKLHDSLLAGLIGYAQKNGRTRTMFLGGVAALLDHPTVDTRSGEHVVIGDDDSLQFVLMGGLDVIVAASPRVSFVFGGRYAYIDRDEHSGRYLGIGSHVLRAGGGIRVRLN
jgi:hypothetical protein